MYSFIVAVVVVVVVVVLVVVVFCVNRFTEKIPQCFSGCNTRKHNYKPTLMIMSDLYKLARGK